MALIKAGKDRFVTPDMEGTIEWLPKVDNDKVLINVIFSDDIVHSDPWPRSATQKAASQPHMDVKSEMWLDLVDIKIFKPDRIAKNQVEAIKDLTCIPHWQRFYSVLLDLD